MKLIIAVITAAIVVQDLQAASIDFDETNHGELIQSVEKTLKCLLQQKRSVEWEIISENLNELKKMIEIIKFESNSTKLIGLKLRMENIKLGLRQKMVEANNHPESLGCPSLGSLLNYVKKLNLDINLDLSKLDQTKLANYAKILQNLADQAEKLEQQIEQADPTNAYLTKMFLQQYYQLRNEFLQARKALPYLQQLEMLEKLAEELKKQIDTDVQKLTEKKLNSLVQELNNDKANLDKMVKDLKNETNLKAIINKTNALRNYEQSLQQHIFEIERKIINPSVGSP